VGYSVEAKRIHQMFSGIVIAGGKSKRMGMDKRHIMLLGTSLLELSINRLRSITEEVIVVLGEEENLGIKGIRFVLDLEREMGPMVGLFSGLSEMKTPYGLVTPVDVPLLTDGFLGYLKERAVGYGAAVPRWKRGIEPLIAAYSKDLLPFMKERMSKGRNPSLHLLVQELKPRVRFIEEEEISKFGDPEILFLNINTEEDLKKAKRIIGEDK
jgi:molybdopterin-guanine dinucleotide biosynthesis protein A